MGSGWKGTAWPSTTTATGGTSTYGWWADELLTKEQQAMVAEAICDELAKFGPGIPKTYSWISSPISGTFTSGSTVTFDMSYDEK